MLRRVALRWVLALAGLLFVAAAGAASPTLSLDQIRRLGFASDDIGYILFDLRSRAVLAEQNVDQLFLPASVTKLATAYAAARILGPGYRFSTLLYRRGNDLYLKGGGDPVLDAVDLDKLAKQLAAAAPQPASTGGAPLRFFYDDSLMTSLSAISDRQPVAASYNTGLSALAVDFNRIEADWSQGADGRFSFRALCLADGLILPADWISFAPAAADVPAEMPFLYVGKDGAGTPDRWLYSPHLPGRGYAFLPVKATSLHTALVFRELAKAAGVQLAMPERGRVPPDAVVVAGTDSPPLPEILKGLLRYSNNPSAELVGLAASRELTGRSLALAPSAAALAAWLKRQAPRVHWQGFLLANHSGLAPESRVSPRQMAELLFLAAEDNAVMQALPSLSGEGIALAQGENPRGLIGKSGTMDYARSLAGYFIARDGRLLGFAIFAFDRAQRAVLDARMDPRVLEATPAARAWVRRALDLDEVLLRRWMESY